MKIRGCPEGEGGHRVAALAVALCSAPKHAQQVLAPYLKSLSLGEKYVKKQETSACLHVLGWLGFYCSVLVRVLFQRVRVLYAKTYQFPRVFIAASPRIEGSEPDSGHDEQMGFTGL